MFLGKFELKPITETINFKNIRVKEATDLTYARQQVEYCTVINARPSHLTIRCLDEEVSYSNKIHDRLLQYAAQIIMHFTSY